jgi:hypothetical protein
MLGSICLTISAFWGQSGYAVQAEQHPLTTQADIRMLAVRDSAAGSLLGRDRSTRPGSGAQPLTSDWIVITHEESAGLT